MTEETQWYTTFTMIIVSVEEKPQILPKCMPYKIWNLAGELSYNTFTLILMLNSWLCFKIFIFINNIFITISRTRSLILCHSLLQWRVIPHCSYPRFIYGDLTKSLFALAMLRNLDFNIKIWFSIEIVCFVFLFSLISVASTLKVEDIIKVYDAFFFLSNVSV